MFSHVKEEGGILNKNEKRKKSDVHKRRKSVTREDKK